MRVTRERREALEQRYGIRLRVIFHETDVTSECVEADSSEGWWAHEIVREGQRTGERARLHGPIRIWAEPGAGGCAAYWRWRLLRALRRAVARRDGDRGEARLGRAWRGAAGRGGVGPGEEPGVARQGEAGLGLGQAWAGIQEQQHSGAMQEDRRVEGV